MKRTSTAEEKRIMKRVSEMVEEWRPIAGWEGLYEVSNYGQVKTVSRKIRRGLGEYFFKGGVVKPIEMGNGYLAVNLTRSGKREQRLVHRIVLESFVGKSPSGFQACHNNGIRSDCRLENLRWDSVIANHEDKRKHGTLPIGESVHNARLNYGAVQYIRVCGKPIKLLAKELGVSAGCVEKAKYRQTWRHVK